MSSITTQTENLWQDWKETMKSLWHMAKNSFPTAVNKQFEIEINEWAIKAVVINKQYVQAEAWKKDDIMITIRLHNNLPAVVHCIYLLISIDNKINEQNTTLCPNYLPKKI